MSTVIRPQDGNRYLSQCIKEAGQTLIDNAEDFAGKAEGITDFYIRIDFPKDKEYIPEIEVTRTHVPGFKAVDRLFELRERLMKMEKENG